MAPTDRNRIAPGTPPAVRRQQAESGTPPAVRRQHLESEYGHSSGDRNTRTDELDWKHFKDGKERTEHADPPPASDDSHRRT